MARSLMDELFGDQDRPEDLNRFVRKFTEIPDMSRDEAIHIRAIELAIESFRGQEPSDREITDRAEKLRRMIERGYA